MDHLSKLKQLIVIDVLFPMLNIDDLIQFIKTNTKYTRMFIGSYEVIKRQYELIYKNFFKIPRHYSIFEKDRITRHSISTISIDIDVYDEIVIKNAAMTGNLILIKYILSRYRYKPHLYNIILSSAAEGNQHVMTKYVMNNLDTTRNGNLIALKNGILIGSISLVIMMKPFWNSYHTLMDICLSLIKDRYTKSIDNILNIILLCIHNSIELSQDDIKKFNNKRINNYKWILYCLKNGHIDIENVLKIDKIDLKIIQYVYKSGEISLEKIVHQGLQLNSENLLIFAIDNGYTEYNHILRWSIRKNNLKFVEYLMTKFGITINNILEIATDMDNHDIIMYCMKNGANDYGMIFHWLIDNESINENIRDILEDVLHKSGTYTR